jgi:hypothetical protein
VSVRVNMRIDDGLWAWIGEYAAKRGSSKTAVVEAAVREFRQVSARGVPDLNMGAIRAEADAQVRAADRLNRPAFMERQAKLNQAKYGGKS